MHCILFVFFCRDVMSEEWFSGVKRVSRGEAAVFMQGWQG